MYRTELPDLFASVVADVDLSMTITDHSRLGNVHTMTVCDLKWIEVGRTLTIGGNSYVVTGINYDLNMITATGTENLNTATFDLYAPIFFYGTPLDQDQQLKAIRQTVDKTPMVYLLMNYRERNLPDPENPIEREVVCRLFFLTSENFDKATTALTHTAKIIPMSRLMQAFIDTLQADKASFYMDEFSYDSTPQYKFGVYVTNTGAKKSFFVDQLAGWEMSIDNLPVRKGHTCTSCRADASLEGIGFMQIGDDFIVR